MKRLSLALAVLLLFSCLLVSCASSGMSEDEIRETYRSLVEQSYVLNDVYYGDGLPFVKNDAVMAHLAGVGEVSEGFRVSYMPVDEAAVFTSEASIREATSAVFSPMMAEHLFQLGFAGLSVGESAETVAYARYIEQEGILTVRIDLAEEALDVARTYDFSKMTLIADEESRILASFPTEKDGKPSVDVKLTLIRTPDGWRLDSPTY